MLYDIIIMDGCISLMLTFKMNSFISPSPPLQSSLILDPTFIRSPLATEVARAWSSLTYGGPQAMKDLMQ